MGFLSAAASSAVLRRVWAVLSFGLTIPIWLMLAVAIWLYFDRASDIRKAVDDAVTELVAGAELEAAGETIRAQSQIINEIADREERLKNANDEFASKLEKANVNLGKASDAVAALSKRPVNSDCRVDSSVHDLLRSK